MALLGSALLEQHRRGRLARDGRQLLEQRKYVRRMREGLHQ